MKTINWLASYPKSGNTWVRFFLATYRDGAREPLQMNRVGTVSRSESRLTEYQAIAYGDDPNVPRLPFLDPQIDALRRMVQERLASLVAKNTVVKTHNARVRSSGFPLIRREFTRSIVYIVRNPLDLVDSLADHCGLDIDHAIELMNDPRHRIGTTETEIVTQYLVTWSGHVRSWIETKFCPLLVVRYEDLLADPVGRFREMLEFLDWELDEARLQRAIEFTSFEVLRNREQEQGFNETSKNSRAGRFFRRGKSRVWDDVLSSNQIARLTSDHRDVMQSLGYL